MILSTGQAQADKAEGQMAQPETNLQCQDISFLAHRISGDARVDQLSFGAAALPGPRSQTQRGSASFAP